MSAGGNIYTQCYNLRGDGDISAATAIQAQLREHGVCSFFNWDPRPPHWRFFYETNLSRPQIEQMLGALRHRFNVEVIE